MKEKKVDPKVSAATLAGAATTLVVFALQGMGADMPPEAAASLTTVLAFLAGYLRRSA